MTNNYSKLFGGLKQIEPPKRLHLGILLRISFAQRRFARIKMALSSLVALFSFVLMVFDVQYIASGFAKSGFYQYFTLIFSDTGAVLSYWKEFSMSLAESMPLFELTALFAVTFVLLGALKFAIDAMKNAFLPRQFNS